MYEEDSPEKLAVLLKGGDHHAFTEIFHRYNALLYSHVYNKLRDAEQARDIVHEVFFSLWARREKIEVTTSLLAYLFAAARYKVADFLSHKQVEDKYIVSLQAFIQSQGHQSGADYRARENQLQQLIEQEIAALPPRMQQIFRMSRFDQLSHREIAEALQLSEETVKDQVKKALRVLRSRLGIWAVLLLSFQDL
jgi:RNA polymerase sigma-70 factor (ECF subfamily)